MNGRHRHLQSSPSGTAVVGHQLLLEGGSGLVSYKGYLKISIYI